ncbi:MAG: hypothetical protein ACOYJ6_04540 [Caulobacterales bacterium]
MGAQLILQAAELSFLVSYCKRVPVHVQGHTDRAGQAKSLRIEMTMTHRGHRAVEILSPLPTMCEAQLLAAKFDVTFSTRTPIWPRRVRFSSPGIFARRMTVAPQRWRCYCISRSGAPSGSAAQRLIPSPRRETQQRRCSKALAADSERQALIVNYAFSGNARKAGISLP